MNYLCRYVFMLQHKFFSTKSQCAILKLVHTYFNKYSFLTWENWFFWYSYSEFHSSRLDADLFLTRNPNIFTKPQWSEFPNFVQQLKVSKSRKQFMVSSILPKNKRKQFDLRYHRSKVDFFLFIFWENWGDHKMSAFGQMLSRFTDL